MNLTNNQENYIGIVHNPHAYYQTLDNSPSQVLELCDGNIFHTCEDRNTAYAMVKRLLILLEMDKPHVGTSLWNPLGDLISPGMKVLIKPNWVRDFNAGPVKDNMCMYTQLAVITPILEYVFKALNGKGKVIIGDAPLQSCNLERLLNQIGILHLLQKYEKKGLFFEIRDFRLTLWKNEKEGQGDPSGYTLINLERDSLHTFKDTVSNRYRVASYNPNKMNEHHSYGKHEYLICNTALEADVIINVPKLKTHKKTAFTGALKNFVGVVGKKEFLPHHTKGDPSFGGDEYPNRSILMRFQANLSDFHFSNFAKKHKVIKIISGVGINCTRKMLGHSNCQLIDGSWSGNDTLWRTILDLNRIILFYDFNERKMSTIPQRKILTIVDGIIAGEGDGPLAPIPKKLGLILGGMDSVAIDAAIAQLIGFDGNIIPMVSRSFTIDKWPLTSCPDSNMINIKLYQDDHEITCHMSDLFNAHLKPSLGWSNVVRRGNFKN